MKKPFDKDKEARKGIISACVSVVVAVLFVLGVSALLSIASPRYYSTKDYIAVGADLAKDKFNSLRKDFSH
jgi:hypothetical protein